MSLVSRYHILLAGSTAVSVLIPWYLLQPGGSAIDIPPALPPAAARLPQLPPVPDSAMEGRLFFAALEQLAPASADPATAAAPLPAAPTLVGTALSRRGRAAAILRSSAGTTQLLASGQTIDGWRVTRIADGVVTIVHAGQQQQLTLDRAAQ